MSCNNIPEPSSPVKSAWLRLFDLASSSLLVSAMLTDSLLLALEIGGLELQTADLQVLTVAARPFRSWPVSKSGELPSREVGLEVGHSRRLAARAKPMEDGAPQQRSLVFSTWTIFSLGMNHSFFRMFSFRQTRRQDAARRRQISKHDLGFHYARFLSLVDDALWCPLTEIKRDMTYTVCRNTIPHSRPSTMCHILVELHGFFDVSKCVSGSAEPQLKSATARLRSVHDPFHENEA